MTVPELLRRATELVPAGVRSGTGWSSADVREYLREHEWGVALGLLQEFDGLGWQPAEFWDLLADAAQRMRLEYDMRWCRWRGDETRCGSIIRAELQLLAPEAGGPRQPLPGTGRLRPMWAVGDGDVGRRIARFLAESTPEIPVGGQGTIRLLPFTPDAWRHLRRGDLITMHQRRPAIAAARIIEIQRA
ncbi:hypothetical protein [Nocardia sp. alder85J]|uniref:hypothetical protein n=1 Tax=Nocardia sp. alder85J TaxID=2862949 RepID=UPI001CD64DB5|nr:hypothetical protein [Nocardia sp. alder85J]MCX4097126.1 hypothetical protein [Nocardia sp. alder85J]